MQRRNECDPRTEREREREKMDRKNRAKRVITRRVTNPLLASPEYIKFRENGQVESKYREVWGKKR